MPRPPDLRRGLLPLLLIPALAVGGCLRRVQYDAPDGRRVDILNLGFDTRIGTLEAETTTGRVRIEGFETEPALAKDLTRIAADLAVAARLTAEGGAK